MLRKSKLALTVVLAAFSLPMWAQNSTQPVSISEPAAGSVAEEDFQVALRGIALLGLDLFEKAVRVGAAAFEVGHLV